MDGKTWATIATLGSIIFGVLAPLLAWFAGGSTLQGNEKEIVRQILNFEFLIFIICFIAGWIPLINLLVWLIAWIATIVYAVKGYTSIGKNEPFKAPGYEFMK